MRKLIAIFALSLFAFTPHMGVTPYAASSMRRTIAAVATVKDCLGANGGTTSNTMNSTGANTIVVAASWFGSLPADPTDNKSNTNYTLQIVQTTFSISSGIWTSENANVGSGHTISFPCTNCYPSVVATAYSGVKTSSATDSATAVGGSSVTNLMAYTSPYITPTEDNTVVIASIATDDNSSGAVTIDNGFTKTDNQLYTTSTCIGGGQAYKVQTTAQTENPQWDVTNTTASLRGAMIALKAAAGGGGGATAKPLNVPIIIMNPRGF